MAKIKVDEFIIEVGFAEKVSKGLQALEKKVQASAQKLETRLNRVFSKDYSKGLNATFNKIDKRALQSARNINKALNSAFNVKQGSNMFSNYEREGLAAARRVQQAMRDAANAGRTQRGTNGTNTGNGTNRPRITPADRLAQRQQRMQTMFETHQTSARYGNLRLSSPERADQYMQRLTALHQQHSATGDIASFRSGLRSLNFEFDQQTRAARLLRTAGSGTTGMLGGLTEALGPLVAGFMSLQAVMHLFQASLEQGIKATQSRNMISAAFRGNASSIMQQSAALADKYGLDTNDTQASIATLRQTMPEKQFNDQKVLSLFENENAFAHMTGASQQRVDLFNVGLQQLAASPSVMKQDFNQIYQNMPAIVKPLMQLTHTDNVRAAYEALKAMKSGGKAAETIYNAMVMANKESDAFRKYQESIQASQGRFHNSENRALTNFFRGYEQQASHMFDALSTALDGSGELITDCGHLLGWFMDRISDIVNVLDFVIRHIEGFIIRTKTAFRNFWESLDTDTQRRLKTAAGYFNDFMDAVIAIILAKLGASGIGKISRIASRLFGVAEGAGVGAGTAAAGSAAATTEATATVATAAAETAATAEEVSAAAAVIANPELWIPAAIVAALGTAGYLMTTPEQRAQVQSYDQNRTTFGQSNDAMQAYYNRTQGTSAQSYQYGQPQQVQVALQQPQPLQVAPIRIDVKQPDGTVTSHEVDAQIQGHTDKMLISTGGTGGGWQRPTDNAGWLPSSLMRNRQ